MHKLDFQTIITQLPWTWPFQSALSTSEAGLSRMLGSHSHALHVQCVSTRIHQRFLHSTFHHQLKLRWATARANSISYFSVGLLHSSYTISSLTWLHVHMTTCRRKFMQVSCDVSRSSCYTFNLCLMVAAGEVRRMSSLFNRSQCRDDTGDDRQTVSCLHF